MNDIITANIPEFVRVFAIALLFIGVISTVVLINSYNSQNEKLFNISYKTVALSIILMLVSTIAIPLGSRYMTDSAIRNHQYEIKKTEDQIIIKSQSPWLKSHTYEIVGYKNETYYLKSEDGLKEIKDSELK